jgi:hypothetical protein
MLADKALSANLEKLRKMFTKWRDTGTSLQPIMENSPALTEAKQLSFDLTKLGEIGLEAISNLENNSGATAEWQDGKLKMLDEIAKPKAALEFQVVGNLKKLVSAAYKRQNSAK